MKVKRNRIDGSVLITVIFLTLVTFAVSQALSPIPSAAIQLVTTKNLIEDGQGAGSETIIRAGTPGISGDIGPQGPRGERGPQGEQGPQGIPGSQGERGPQGEQGVKGETGMVGDQGIQGIQGVQGEKGDRGDTGATGATGATGGSPWFATNYAGPIGYGYTGTGYTGDVMVFGKLYVQDSMAQNYVSGAINKFSQIITNNSGMNITTTGTPSGPSDMSLSSDGNIIMTADNIDVSATSFIYPTLVGNYMQYTTTGTNTSGRLLLNQGTTGGVSNPMFTLNQNDTASGSANILFKKNTSTNGSAIGEMSFLAKTAILGNPEREYARMAAIIRSNTSGNVDGSISLSARINDVLTECMRINGQDSQIEVFQPIDLNNTGLTTGGSIVTSTGDININASGSIGSGNVNITPRSGSSCTFSTQLTLPLPATSGTVFFSGTQLTCIFGGFSTGIFNIGINANMTSVFFSGGRAGGQYVIYITNTSGTTITIGTSLGASTKTNYTTAVTLTPTSVALMTVTFDGTNYLIACSAYN